MIIKTLMLCTTPNRPDW